MKPPKTVWVSGSLKIVKSGRYYSATFPGELPVLLKDYESAMTFAALGESLVRAFCVDKRAATLYFNPAGW